LIYKSGQSSLLNDSIFFKLAGNGLITFSDYLFLLTILSTPTRHFEMAFRMFDLNGDGNVDITEFKKVHTMLWKKSCVGQRHRDHSNTGSVLKSIQPALTTFFFGPKRDQKLTLEKFKAFQRQLQQELHLIEFNSYHPVAGKIKEFEFADALLSHATLPDKKILRMKRKVKKCFKSCSNGICYKEFVDLFTVMNSIHDIELALSFYHMAGAPIDKATFKHVAWIAAGVVPSDHVTDVIFVLFDENQDGHLSHKEFVSVLKNRRMRGLSKPRDTGLSNLIAAMWKCVSLPSHHASNRK